MTSYEIARLRAVADEASQELARVAQLKQQLTEAESLLVEWCELDGKAATVATDNAELRALLGECRNFIYEVAWQKRPIGDVRTPDLLARIDAKLKGVSDGH